MSFSRAQNWWWKLTGNIEDGDLPEDSPLAKSDKDRFAVVSDDVNFASFYNVHLPANVALAADVVAGGEYLQLQFQYQLHE